MKRPCFQTGTGLMTRKTNSQLSTVWLQCSSCFACEDLNCEIEGAYDLRMEYFGHIETISHLYSLKFFENRRITKLYAAFAGQLEDNEVWVIGPRLEMLMKMAWGIASIRMIGQVSRERMGLASHYKEHNFGSWTVEWSEKSDWSSEARHLCVLPYLRVWPILFSL